MTQPEQSPQHPLARWRERRYAKRQAAREREQFARERDPTTLAYTDGEHRARRFASFGGGGGGGDGGGDGG